MDTSKDGLYHTNLDSEGYVFIILMPISHLLVGVDLGKKEIIIIIIIIKVIIE